MFHQTILLLVLLFTLMVVLHRNPNPNRRGERDPLQSITGTVFEKSPYIVVFTSTKELARLEAEHAFVPTGTISILFSDTVPEGWHLCDGSPIPDTPPYQAIRTTLGILYPDIGYHTYPDMRGDTPIGRDARKDDYNLDKLGNRVGEFAHVLETDELPKHEHHLRFRGWRDEKRGDSKWWRMIGYDGDDTPAIDNPGRTDDKHNNVRRTWDLRTYTDSTGRSTPTPLPNVQPSVVVNYIIKL